jgi:predicted nucleotidyltransferase
MTAQELIRQAAVNVPEEDLREIVRRIAEVAGPEKVILFGSAARGEMRPQSDLDLLVVKRGVYNHRAVAAEIYRALRDVDYSTDVLVVTPEDVERYKDSFCLVLYPALREGKVIYDAATL